jgi:hypothetical protein
LRPPIPLDTLLILKKIDDRLVLLESVDSAQDVAIVWNGISEIRSNKDRILNAAPKSDRILQLGVPETKK